MPIKEGEAKESRPNFVQKPVDSQEMLKPAHETQSNCKHNILHLKQAILL